MPYITRRTILMSLLSPLATPAFARNIYAADITGIRVRKSARQLELVGSGRVLKSYNIRLGRKPSGAKRVEGDGKTPEGLYKIDRRNPASRYHLSLGISYPNQNDIMAAQAMRKSPGGDIVIHGQPNGLMQTLQRDWTIGCVALANLDIEELWQVIEVGIPILIIP